VRRLPLLDAVLLAVVVPLWLAAVGLYVVQVAAGRLAWVGIYAAAPRGAEGYPTVSGFWPGVDPGARGPHIGEPLLRVGDADLNGVGPLRFFALAQAQYAAAIERGAQPPLRYLQDDTPTETVLPFVPVRFPWRMLPLTCGLVAAGTLVLLRRPGTAVARRFFLGATVFSLHWTWFFGGAVAVTYAWLAVFIVVTTLVLPLVILEMALFPADVAPARTPRWPWLFAIIGPIDLTAAVGFPFPPAWGLRGMYVINVAVIVALLVVLTRNYRRANARGRRQLKWKMYGFYAGLAPVLFANLVTLYLPALWWLHDLAAIAMVLIPICLLIAITRFNLLDIDRLITSTAIYSILSVLLLALILAVVPLLAEAASKGFSLDHRVGTALFSALSAVSLLALYRSLSPWVERVFFRERFALETGVNGLREVIGSLADPRSILSLVGARLSDLFLSASCAVYESLPLRDGLVPAFATGAVPSSGTLPRLAAHGTLARIVRNTLGPLYLEDASGERRSLDVEPAERAFVDSLAPTVIVPIKSAGELQALISLGAKRSGDVYSPGDLALLSAVADTVGARLEQLDRERRTAAAPLLVPRKFELVERIGQGGMGIVVKVRHVTLGTTVALKILPEHLARDAEFVRRFQREARVMAQLHHPNIVRVLDIDHDGDLQYFVMEYIEGRTLGELMSRTGALPLTRVIDVALEVSAALEYAHRHVPPVVHRDIAPSNILIEEGTGRVVVTDFGIAKVAEAQTALTRTGDFFGKPRYAAPEHLRGEHDVDGRADIYALGMIMYEMFEGRGFFASDDEHEVVRRVLLDPSENVPVFDRMVPDAFRGVVAGAIMKDRDRRYRTAGELREALLQVRRHVLDGDAAESPAPSMPRPPTVAGERSSQAVTLAGKRRRQS